LLCLGDPWVVSPAASHIASLDEHAEDYFGEDFLQEYGRSRASDVLDEKIVLQPALISRLDAVQNEMLPGRFIVVHLGSVYYDTAKRSHPHKFSETSETEEAEVFLEVARQSMADQCGALDCAVLLLDASWAACKVFKAGLRGHLVVPDASWWRGNEGPVMQPWLAARAQQLLYREVCAVPTGLCRPSAFASLVALINRGIAVKALPGHAMASPGAQAVVHPDENVDWAETKKPPRRTLLMHPYSVLARVRGGAEPSSSSSPPPVPGEQPESSNLAKLAQGAGSLSSLSSRKRCYAQNVRWSACRSMKQRDFVTPDHLLTLLSEPASSDLVSTVLPLSSSTIDHDDNGGRSGESDDWDEPPSTNPHTVR